MEGIVDFIFPCNICLSFSNIVQGPVILFTWFRNFLILDVKLSILRSNSVLFSDTSAFLRMRSINALNDPRCSLFNIMTAKNRCIKSAKVFPSKPRNKRPLYNMASSILEPLNPCTLFKQWSLFISSALLSAKNSRYFFFVVAWVATLATDTGNSSMSSIVYVSFPIRNMSFLLNRLSLSKYTSITLEPSLSHAILPVTSMPSISEPSDSSSFTSSIELPFVTWIFLFNVNSCHVSLSLTYSSIVYICSANKLRTHSFSSSLRDLSRHCTHTWGKVLKGLLPKTGNCLYALYSNVGEYSAYSISLLGCARYPITWYSSDAFNAL